MSQIIKADSIQLDAPNVVPAGSFKLDKEDDGEGDIRGSALKTASGLAHTTRAVAETAAGLATGVAAFPISKGTKWIEYGLSGGDLEKAKAAEQRANERIQFNPTTPEAQGALDKVGKYVIDPVFTTLREAGRIPGEAWNSPTMMELGGDVAEIGAPIKAHGMLKTQRAYRSAKPVTEIREPKASEATIEPTEKPVIVKANSVELDKAEVNVESKGGKVIPAESIKLDEVAPEVKAEVKPVIEADLPSAETVTKPSEAVSAKVETEIPIEGKVTKVAKDINKELVERGFNALPTEELAKYNPISKEKTIADMAEFVSKDGELAKKMALGEEPTPAGMPRQVLFETIKEKAYSENDINTIQRLADSPLATERSILAQQLGSAGYLKKLENDPVAAINDIQKARKEEFAKTGQKVDPVKQSAEIERLSKALEETQKALEAHIAGKEMAKAERQARTPKGYGRSNKIVTHESYLKTKQELIEMFGGIHDVTVVGEISVKATKLGIYHLEAGARTFNVWASRMVADVGKQIKPYLEEIWQKSRGAVRDSVAEKIGKALDDGKDFSEVGKQIQALARGFVEEGIKDRNEIVAKVHEIVKEKIPDITPREISDAISGYGKYKLLSKDEISVQLRDIKGQLQQVSKLEDLQNKGAAKKTGIERRIPSDTERELIKQVNEAKKKYGIDTVDSATQLKTTQDAITTRLTNQIADLTSQIESKTKMIKEKTSVVYNEKNTKLKARRDDLQKQYDAIFADPKKTISEKHELAKKKQLQRQIESLEKQLKTGEKASKQQIQLAIDKETHDLSLRRDELKKAKDALFKDETDAKKIESAVTAAKKLIEENKRRIAENDISVKGKTPRLRSEQLDSLRAENNELVKQIREMRNDAKPKKSPDQIALQRLKTRLENERDKYTTKLENLDFAKPERNPSILDREGQRIKTARDNSKKALDAASRKTGTVTTEEAQKLLSLSKQATELKQKYDPVNGWSSLKDKWEYGKAQVAFNRYVDELKTGDTSLSTLAKRRMAEFKNTAKTNPVKAGGDLAVDTLGEISDSSIALVASADNSFIGRQGMITLQTHPTVWAKAAVNSFSDIYAALRRKHGNEIAKDILHADLVSKEHYMNGNYQKSGILAKFEEQYPTSHPARIPLVGRVFKASEIAFTNSALRMRMGTFDLLFDMAKKGGLEINDVLIKDIGEIVNAATARSPVGQSKIISGLLWAPKMMMANVNVLTAHGLGAGLKTNFARKQAAVNLMKIVGETAAVVAVINALDSGSVELDPRSSDFLKYRRGNTHIDLTAGRGQYITLAARWLTGQTKNAQTKIVKDLNIAGFGNRTYFDVGLDFLINKVTPLVRQVVYIGKGKNFEGKKPTLGTVITDLTTPIPVKNIADDSFGDYSDGSAIALIGNLMDVFGVNANTYIQQDHWENKNTKEMKVAKVIFGSEEKFKQANITYNKLLNQRINQLANDRKYLALTDEEKEDVIKRLKKDTKREIIGKIGQREIRKYIGK
jgi:hypothetical protein